MKLALSREEESFADEARTWLNEYLVGGVPRDAAG